MKKLAIIYDERHSMHSPPFSHPERPERVSSVIKYLKENTFLDEVKLYNSSEATKEDILRVHTANHY